ncbi:MAG: phenylalanine--tRNA ligase subunit alpha, partial [Candidatus Phosphoribacter baldrii]
MSGPTTPDAATPGQGADLPAALSEEALAAALEQAQVAFAAAADLDALKAARLAHVDKGAIAGARREIGALPPAAKAEAGKRVGAALDAVRAAYTAREA